MKKRCLTLFGSVSNTIMGTLTLGNASKVADSCSVNGTLSRCPYAGPVP